MEGSEDDATSNRRFKPPKSAAADAPLRSKPQGDVRYIAIRPRPPEPAKLSKPPTGSRLQPLRFQASSGRRRCPVPICQRSNCKLQTHKDYGKYRMQAAQRSLANLKTSRTPSPFLNGDLVGLPELPLGPGQPAVYRALFHDFFGKIYDRIAILLSPPPLSLEQQNKAAEYKRVMLHRSLQAPVHCLNYVASSFVSQRTVSQGHEAAVLYGKVMRLFREKLAHFVPDEVDALLVVILTLVLLDIAGNNYTNLEVHRAGMILLVNSRGGLHNLKTSLIYAESLDRIIATYISKPPLYVPRLDRSLQRPFRFDHVYGAFFESPVAEAADMPKQIVEYCHDLCRAIELFEGQNISYDPAVVGITEATDVHYFYFVRNRLGNEFTFLNAAYADTHGKARCILLAAKIVHYLVLTDNYIAAIPKFLATKIRECLEQQNIEEEWDGFEAALRWVQWTMTCARRDTLTFLVDQAVAMYQRLPFPLDWIEQGLHFKCVRNFVWASSLDERLAQVCNEEDALLRQRLVHLSNASAGPATGFNRDKTGKRKAK